MPGKGPKRKPTHDNEQATSPINPPAKKDKWPGQTPIRTLNNAGVGLLDPAYYEETPMHPSSSHSSTAGTTASTLQSPRRCATSRATATAPTACGRFKNLGSEDYHDYVRSTAYYIMDHYQAHCGPQSNPFMCFSK